MAKTTAVDYFQPYFRKLADKLTPFIDNKPDENGVTMSNSDVSKAIKELSKNLGENIRCAVFRGKNKLLNPQDLKDYEQRFFPYAWGFIHRLSSIDYDGRKSDQALILGREFTNELIKNRSEACILTSSLGKKGVLYYKSTEHELNGIIIFVEYKKNNYDLVKAKIKDYSSNEHPILFFDSLNNPETNTDIEQYQIPLTSLLSKEFFNGFTHKNLVWKGFNAGDYKLLLGQKIEQPQQYKIKKVSAFAIAALLLYILTTSFYKKIFSSKGIYFSIRTKLIIIFILAIYTPTISLWLLSYNSLYNHRTALENKIKKGMLDILNKIDNDYKINEKKVSNLFSKIDKYLAGFKNKKAPTNHEIGQYLQSIVGLNNKIKDHFNWLEIRDINQNQIFTNIGKENKQQLGKIVRVISLHCLDKYCPNRLTSAGIKLSQSDILVGNIFMNPVLGFSSVFERPNQLIFQNFEGSGVYWWWNYYPDPDNPIAFCMGDTSLRGITTFYFKSLLKKRYSYENVNLKLFNFHYGSREFIPYYTKKNEELIKLIEVSNINKTIESAIINYDNDKYLCLCVPGNYLKECFILSMYPIREIDYQIEKIKSNIYKGIILFLIITIFIGLLLTQNFIKPIKEINNGLNALRERDTEIILNIESNDEFGLFGSAFNKMMLNIKDLLMAGSVQRCIIPSGTHEIDGYDCHIFNKMAKDVGGDYADIFNLPDNKQLITIGEVNNNGISSSLLVAMVKASIFRFANKNTDLIKIMTNINSMLYDLLKRNNTMSLCIIILEKDTGKLSICNAGNITPIIKKDNNKIQIIKSNNLPLGSVKNPIYSLNEEILLPQNCLILYTNGILNTEKDIGIKYSQNDIIELIANKDVKEFEKEYFNKNKLSKDITFITLSKKSFQYN